MGNQNSSGPAGQRGFIMILVPIILAAICILGIQMIGRSKAAMKTASTDLSYLQTRLCSQQCVSLTTNRLQKSLEASDPIIPGVSTCECTDPSGPGTSCEVTVNSPVEETAGDCYGVKVKTTTAGILSSCGGKNASRAELQENVDFNETPLFQFAVFYDKSMLIDNFQDMTLDGKVHSNSNIDMSPQGDLWLPNWVTTPGLIRARFRTTEAGNKIGHIHFKEKSSNAYYVLSPRNTSMNAISNLISGYGSWMPDHKVAFGKDLNSCDVPVRPFTLPVPKLKNARDIIDWRGNDMPNLAKAKYANKADLIFYNDKWMNNDLSNANLSIEPIIFPPTPAGWGSILVGTRQRVKFWEGREGFMTKLIPVDVNVLQQRSTDGVIYLYDDLIESGDHTGGFLLYNGATLKRPLTIVTNSRMMLYGDFNTAKNFEPTWCAAKKSGSVTMYPFPASLVSDNFTQLSNDLIPGEHTKVSPGGGTRININHATTVNACILTGNTRDANGNDPGAVENLIRYLENWQGAPYVRSGSLANLWESKHSTTLYQDGTEYFHAPERDYEFGEIYECLGNMPPGTPRMVVPNLVDWEQSRQ